ncbi:histidine kinase [Streptomyces sp. LX-29]|uniref:histidine kinase n=1 Tax=Streptomyces sp. LX-29 TaxID=2900152 RepID=UPI00240E8899|nr:histidine kinase [Streptomyces sp. LX-29]WFB08671.1 histidine kinase [Streptomyces sp. LX-29]
MFGRVQKWRGRSKIAQVDLFSRWMLRIAPWVLMLSWGLLPLLGAVESRPLPLSLAAALVLLSVVQCATGMGATQRALDHYLGKGGVPRRQAGLAALLMVLTLGLTLALCAVGGLDVGTAVLLVGWVTMPFGGVSCLLVPKWTFAAVYGGIAALTTLGFFLVGVHDGRLCAVVLVVAFQCGFSLLTIRCSGWMLGVMWEVHDARAVQARLAVAEERLRFGRDMHDVLGRNLAVIALKSELAVQLARRGRPEAVEQMVEVLRITQESQREIRDVVRGYREADLHTELVGARGVLAAAGIDCRIEGATAGPDGTDPLPSAVQSALGWVVREGTTNVLRHADAARHCAIRVEIAAGDPPGRGSAPAAGRSATSTVGRTAARVAGRITGRPAEGAPAGRDAAPRGRVAVLVMENDGVPGTAATDRGETADAAASGAAPGGSGLAGLRERLAALGGTVVTGAHPGGRFRLTARIPLDDASLDDASLAGGPAEEAPAGEAPATARVRRGTAAPLPDSPLGSPPTSPPASKPGPWPAQGRGAEPDPTEAGYEDGAAAGPPLLRVPGTAARLTEGIR